jgi:cell division initiation protein
MQANALLNESKLKAKNRLDESELRAKEVIAEMEERLKQLIDSYKKIESSREDLLSEFKRLATEALEKVDRAKKFTLDFDPEKHLSEARRETKNVLYPNGESVKSVSKESTSVVEQVVIEQQTVVVETPSKKVQKSFFDSIE